MHLGMIISLVTQLIYLYVPTVTARTIAFFIDGVAVFKNTAAYTWSTENVPLEHRSYAITAINMYFCLPAAIFGIYSLLISRDWYPLLLFNFCTNLLAYLMLFVMPESPKWLLYGGRREDAIASLNYMAWFNGCDKESYIPEDADFEELEAIQAKDESKEESGQVAPMI